MSTHRCRDMVSWLYRSAPGVTLVVLLGLGTATHARGEGLAVFSSSLTSSVTGEKPQSKIFYRDGSYWAVLRGPSGVAFYELVDGTWRRGQFMDAILTTSGNADILCDGDHLYVLVYSTYPKLFEYVYDAPIRAWKLLPGFPVSVPRPSGAETMMLEKDSTGRLWTTAEGSTKINVYYTTSADHRAWSSTPIVLQTGVDTDDISAVIAFAGDKIGVLWSDQMRNEFGFRVHHDGAAPEIWDREEIVDAGLGCADDHINLKTDTRGRVYAITKDAFDHMQVHRRSVDGTWNTKYDVLEAIGTRGILMLSEAESRAYILYTRWGVIPDRIEYRYADLETLEFGGTTTFISASSSTNNVTGMKQPLPPGSLVAMAEGASRVWWNGWGSPPVPDDSSRARCPTALVATLLPSPKPTPSRVELAWSPPSAAEWLVGYNVYKMLGGGPYERLNSAPVAQPSYTDSTLALGSMCYRVTALAAPAAGSAEEASDATESGPSNSACVDFLAIPGEPPPPPADLAIARLETSLPGPASGAAAYAMDEGAGQLLSDATGDGHIATLGNSSSVESADPLWTDGVAGSALRFNGTNDRVRVTDAAGLRMSGGFTLEAWIQRPTSGGTGAGCIVAKGDAGRRNYSLVIDGSNRVEFRWQTAGGINHGVVSTAKILDVRWHHIAAVFDQAAGEDRIYVDGRLVKRAADSGIPVTSADPLYIGARAQGSSVKYFFFGSIDLVRIAPGATYGSNFTPPTAYGTGEPRFAVQLAWQPPAGLSPAGYNIYAEYGGMPAVKRNDTPVTALAFRDAGVPIGSACYRASSVDSTGREGSVSEAVCITMALGKPEGLEPDPGSGPDVGLGVSPNPFNPETSIRFRLPAPGPVSLVLYDVRGRKVATLQDGPLPAGEQQVRWSGRLDDGGRAASGVYFLRLRAAGADESRRLVLVK